MTTIMAPPFDARRWFVSDGQGGYKIRADAPDNIREKIKAYQKSVGPALSKKLEY